MLDHLDSQLVQHFLTHLPSAIALLDQHGRMAWFNNEFVRVTGQADTGSALKGKTVNELPRELQTLFSEELTVLEGRNGQHVYLAAVSVPMGEHTLFYFSDVTNTQEMLKAHQLLQNKIQELMPTDPVTNLFNQRAMLSQLEQEAARSRRYGNTLSIMFFRLPTLHSYRARYGNDEADGLMLAIAQSLKDQMRWADVIGRFADNEFMFILPETAEQAAADLCGKILEQVSRIPLVASDAVLQIDFGMTQWRKGDDVGMFMSRARENLEIGTARKVAS